MKNKMEKLNITQQELIKGGHFAWTSGSDGCEYEIFYNSDCGGWEYTGNYRCWAIIRPGDNPDNSRAQFEEFSRFNGISYTDDIINSLFPSETT